MFEALISIAAKGPAGIWAQLTNLSAPRMAIQGASAGGLVYTFGGSNNDVSNPAADFKSFDPTTGSWTVRATGPVRRSYHCMCEASGKIYLFSGRGNVAGNLGDLWVYDPANDTWTSKLAGSARQLSAMTSYNEKLYISCGFTTATQADLRSYDIATNTWSTLASHSGAPRTKASLDAIDGKLYLVGGLNGSTRLQDFWVYDIAGGGWSQLPDLPFGACFEHRSTVVAGKLYISGGRDTGNAFTKRMWCYDPVAAEWTQLTSASIQRGEHFAVGVPDGKIYVGGGYSTGVMSDMWSFTI